MSQVSGGVEVSPGMVDLASYKEGDVAGEVWAWVWRKVVTVQ
jgi:hypothetical protein